MSCCIARIFSLTISYYHGEFIYLLLKYETNTNIVFIAINVSLNLVKIKYKTSTNFVSKKAKKNIKVKDTSPRITCNDKITSKLSASRITSQ